MGIEGKTIGDSMMMIVGGSVFRGTPTPSMFQYYCPNVDEVFERALAAGGTVLIALLEDHGDRFGSVRDPFGNDWIIGTHLGAKYVPEGLRDVTIYLHPEGRGEVHRLSEGGLRRRGIRALRLARGRCAAPRCASATR